MTKKKAGDEGLNRPFQGLARLAVPPKPAAAPAPATRQAAPAPRRPAPVREDDSRAFEEAMRGATPLAAEERRRRAPAARDVVAPPPARAPSPAARGAIEAEDDALLADLVTGAGTFTVEIVGETIAGRAAGIDARLLRRLRAGQYAPEATLDLHGRGRAEALAALERFVTAGQAQGRRSVLVIHGRGNNSAADGPVLKPAVWEWLTTSRCARRAVMAFASARPDSGGDGATVVLLRRPTRHVGSTPQG